MKAIIVKSCGSCPYSLVSWEEIELEGKEYDVKSIWCEKYDFPVVENEIHRDCKLKDIDDEN